MLVAVVLLVALNVCTMVLSYQERTRLLNAVIAKNSTDFKRLEGETTKRTPVERDSSEMIFGL